ncbi:MAG: hypothetical protein RML95_13875 [Anaerolineae bacterium]|nr:hypothetical protein [Anaerolineae bacterium]
MSQYELIDTLERLHETYSERCKRITALLNEVKADYKDQRKAQNRRNRIKDGYVQYRLFYPEDMPPEEAIAPDPPPAVWAIQDSERTRMRSNLNTLNRVVKALHFAAEALQTEPLDAVKLAKGQEMLKALRSALPELPDILGRYEVILQATVERLSITFGATLRDAFAAEGLTLEGRPPHMHVGRFRIALDFTKRTANLSYGKEPVGKSVKLSAELILKAYRAAYKEIYEREMNGEEWIKQLYEAWRTTCFRQGSRESDASLVACYVELALQRQSDSFLRREPRKSLFKEYTRAQFAYDADLFITRRGLRYDGWMPILRTASKAQTSSPERAIWIVSGDTPDIGSYFSTLAFRKDG